MMSILKDRKYLLSIVAMIVLAIGSLVILGVRASNENISVNDGSTLNIYNQVAESETSLGGSTSADWNVGGALNVTGTATLSAGVVLDTGSITATTTLTSASDNYQLLPASANATTITLPAATDGLRFEFLVTGALTGGFVAIDSAEGDNINGILMVNDADVACVDEDQINIVTDGEVIGDRVEIISDGTGWYILDSDGDASEKITCTDPT